MTRAHPFLRSTSKRDEVDVLLLLVCADFIASEFGWEKEMQPAMKRHDAREATVVPTILRDVDWHGLCQACKACPKTPNP